MWHKLFYRKEPRATVPPEARCASGTNVKGMIRRTVGL
jgi:hypothetical protein